MYNLGLSNKILKILDELDDTLYVRISNKINGLANNPRPNGSIKLTNFEGYRIRVGNYRILYKIDELNKEVTVYHISHRNEVYKKK